MVANASYTFVSQMTTAAFTAILTLYLVRALAPSQYGDFALAVGIATLVALPADFGISSSTARFVAEQRGDRTEIGGILADSIRLKLVASGAACGALAALAGPIADAYHAPLTWPLRLAAIAVFGQSFMFLVTGAFVAAGQAVRNVAIVFGESAIECSTSIVLVIVAGGAAAAAAGRALGYVCGGLLALALAARVYGWPAALMRRGRPRSVRRIARYALPLMLVDGAFSLFSMIDLLLIGVYLSSREVGLFGASLRLLTLLTYPGLAIASGVAPRMARTGAGQPSASALAQGLRGSVLFHSALLAPLIVWAGPLVHLLLGYRYLDATETVRVMSLAIYLGGLAPLLSLSANYLGDARSRVPLMIGAALLDGGIDVVLIPRIGIVSGAIATAAAYAMMNVGHLVICRRHLELALRPVALTVVRGLIAAACMSAVFLALGTDPSLPVLLAGGLASIPVFVIALLLLGETTSEELARGRAQLTALASRVVSRRSQTPPSQGSDRSSFEPERASLPMLPHAAMESSASHPPG